MSNRPETSVDLRIAVISDPHSELAALDSVLDAVDASGIERIWCLGDIVGGRGIDPAECHDRVLERCEVVIAGNHDRVVAGLREPWALGPFPGIERSRTVLAQTPQRLAQLAGLPSHHSLIVDAARRSWTVELAHGCPRPFDTVDDYIEEDVAPSQVFDALPEADLVLVGHTHVPAAWTSDGDAHRPDPTDDEFSVRLAPTVRAIVNPGSIAPGRDGNARPTWLELSFGHDALELTWRRSGETAYDA